MLAITDATREMLEAIGSSGNDGDNDYADLIRKLHLLEKDMTGVFASAGVKPEHAEVPNLENAEISAQVSTKSNVTAIAPAPC